MGHLASGKCQPPQAKRKPIVCVGSDPHEWGWAGGPSGPMQSRYSGGLVGKGSEVSGKQGPKGKGHREAQEHSSRAHRRKQGFLRS